MICEAEYLHPQWDHVGRVHEWKAYVSDELRTIWHLFTPEQKRILAEAAMQRARWEDDE